MEPEELLSNLEFVQSLARSLVSDANQAADIEQQTWLAALERPPTRGTLRLWLSKVTLNFSRRLYRAEKRRKKYENAAGNHSGITPPDKVVEREETRHHLIKAVLSLEDPYRTAILLRYYDGLPPREMAKHLNMPLERVKTHLKRGLAQLRQKLDTQHGGNRRKWLMALVPLAGVKMGGEASAAGVGSVVGGLVVMSTKTKFILSFLIIACSLGLLSITLFKNDDVGNSYIETVNNGTSIHVVQDNQNNAEAKTENVARLIPPAIEDVQPSYKTYQVYGSVLLRADSTPIKNVIITINPISNIKNSEPITLSTNSQGEFTGSFYALDNESPDSIYLTSSLEGYLDTKTSININSSNIDCGIIYLDSDKYHTIKVVNLSGAGIKNAVVHLLNERFETAVYKYITDINGCCHIYDHVLVDNQPSWSSIKRLNTIHIKAEGYGDYIDFDVNWDSINPIIIKLAPPNIWHGKVIDNQSNHGIANAKIVHSIYIGDNFFALKGLIDKAYLLTHSDAYGLFSMPTLDIVNLSDKKYYIRCHADDYKTYSSDKCGISLNNKYPGILTLEIDKRDKLLCKAIDDQSKLPLKKSLVQIYPSYNSASDQHTDSNGIFKLVSFSYSDLEKGRELSLYITEIDNNNRKFVFDNILNENLFEDGVCVLPFKEIIMESVKVGVKESTGKPVKGACPVLLKESPYHKNRFHSCRTKYTDNDGIVCFDLWLTQPTKIMLKNIHCDGYQYHRQMFFELPLEADYSDIEISYDENNESIMWFTMNRSTLIQNVKVVNQSGQPIPDACVIASLDLIKKDTVDQAASNIFRLTNKDGVCDINFPPFKEGELYIKERTDTLININPDDVYNSNLVIVCRDEPQVHRSIRGAIWDENNKPLSGIIVMPVDKTDKRRLQHCKQVISDKNGEFILPVAPNRYYNLNLFKVSSNRNKSTCIKRLVKTEPGVDLIIKITNDQLSGLNVSFSALWEKHCDIFGKNGAINTDIKYEAWLEDVSGARVNCIKKKAIWNCVTFYGINASKVKCIVIFHSGERYETEYIDLKREIIEHYILE
jgi:RNA polymerase sigma-70 factor (ECF subfamily)